MSAAEQKQMMAEQIHKSTRSSDIRPATVTQGSKYFRDHASVKNVTRDKLETDQALVDGKGPSDATFSTSDDLKPVAKEVHATPEAYVSGVTEPSTKDAASEISRPAECSPAQAPPPMSDVSDLPAAGSFPLESEQTVNA